MIYPIIVLFSTVIFCCITVYNFLWFRTTCAIVFTLALLWYMGPTPTYYAIDPDTAIKYALIYLAIGVLWSVIAWSRYVKNRYVLFKDVINPILSKEGYSEQDIRADGNNRLRSAIYDALGKEKLLTPYRMYLTTSADREVSYELLMADATPKASNYLTMIAGQIAYWPFCALTKVSLSCRTIFVFIASCFTSVYDQISANTFK